MRCCSECTVVHNTHYPIIYRAELAKEKDQLRRILADDVKRLETQQAVSSKQREEQAVAATQDKEGLAVEVAGLRTKVSSLQLDLDNSVAVQNDFVRLSQSLQVELEKIRQQEKEVQWQHEEDVEECGGCRQGGSITEDTAAGYSAQSVSTSRFV